MKQQGCSSRQILYKGIPGPVDVGHLRRKVAFSTMEICQPTAKSPLLGFAFPGVRTGVSDGSMGTGVLNEFQVKGSGS